MNYKLRITKMKLQIFYFSFFIFHFSFFVPFAPAQEWVRLLFPVKEHDFETVPRGAKTHYRFEITNPFEEEIHFGEATSSCTCATPVIETPVLKAHETGAVLVHFNTEKDDGNQKATIHVSIEKPYPAIATLQVRGHIRGDVTFEPSSVFFGSVPVGEEREKTIKIVYHGTNGVWNIHRVENTNPNITAEIGKTTLRRGRIEVEITLKLDEDAPVGRINENIFLISSDTTAARIPLLVVGEVRPPIVVRPDEFSLGTVYEGDEIIKRIVLLGNKPFFVKGLTVSENFISVTPQSPLGTESKQAHEVRLKFTIPKVEGTKSIGEKIVFETDNPEVSPTLTIFAVIKQREEDREERAR